MRKVWVDGNGKAYDDVMDVPAVALAAVVRGRLRANRARLDEYEALDALMAKAAEGDAK